MVMKICKTGWHRDDAYLIKIIKENLSISCEKMINSDVPASILLSGGLDSSIITAIYSKVLNKKLILLIYLSNLMKKF